MCKKLLSCLALFICYLNVVSQEWDDASGSLVGITVTGETMLDIIKINLPDFSTEVLLPNATEVNIAGFTPSFSTAVCKSTNLFVVAINDVMHPRLLVFDLPNRKVKGIIPINGILIDNIECDDEGNGFAYVFQLGKKHTVVKIDFSTLHYSNLMYSSYKSYGGSSIDSKAKRFFTVADTPYYDSFNYSINVIDYGNHEEYLTLPFKNYSIGGIVYDSYLQKTFGFVQTPADIKEGVKYKTYLAELKLNKGVMDLIAGPWERVTLIEESGLTLDVKSSMVYVMTDEKIRKVDVVNRKVIVDRPTTGLPWPIKCYEFVDDV